MKRYISMAVIALTLAACAPRTQPAATPQQLSYPPRPSTSYQFEYQPTPQDNPLTTPIALLKPAFENYVEISTTSCGEAGEAKHLASNALFQGMVSDYATNIVSDFEATLLAKGYTLTGPYESIDLMTFGQKEQAILVLQPQIRLRVNCSDGSPSPYSTAEGVDTGSTATVASSVSGRPLNLAVYSDATLYRTPGSATIHGETVLVMVEPLSGERIWQRDIPVVGEQVSYEYFSQVDYLYTRTRTLLGQLRKDPLRQPQRGFFLADYDGRPAGIARALQATYEAQLDTFSSHFDPQEIAKLIGDAERARERARF